MEDRRFDSLTKSVATRTNRRSLLAGILGIGAGVTAAAVASDSAEAARRGFSGPKLPWLTPPSTCLAEGSSCGEDTQCCSRCCVSAGGGAPFCAGVQICK